jgi:hypothetical protein
MNGRMTLIMNDDCVIRKIWLWNLRFYMKKICENYSICMSQIMHSNRFFKRFLPIEQSEHDPILRIFRTRKVSSEFWVEKLQVKNKSTSRKSNKKLYIVGLGKNLFALEVEMLAATRPVFKIIRITQRPF